MAERLHEPAARQPDVRSHLRDVVVTMSKHVDSRRTVARAPLLALFALPLVASTASAQQKDGGNNGQSSPSVGQTILQKVSNFLNADDQVKKASEAPVDAGLGLLPGTPAVATLPGGVTFGVKPKDEQGYGFDFHGFITMPLRLG